MIRTKWKSKPIKKYKILGFAKNQYDHIVGSKIVSNTINGIFEKYKEHREALTGHSLQNYIGEIKGFEWADRLMDKVFRSGHGIFHSPIHRIVDGHHTIYGATKNIFSEGNNIIESTKGTLAGLWNDFDTKNGIPLITLSEERLNNLAAIFGWNLTEVSQFLSVNSPDIINDMFICISMIMTFTEKDKAKFEEKFGKSLLYNAAGNYSYTPFQLMIILYKMIIFAHAIVIKREKRKIQWASMSKNILRGGVRAGLYKGTTIGATTLGATIGLPILLPIIGSVVVSAIIHQYADDAEKIAAEFYKKINEKMKPDDTGNIIYLGYTASEP